MFRLNESAFTVQVKHKKMYQAKNAANIISSSNSWHSFQQVCCLLWGYHFHFIDSNRASNNSVELLHKKIALICHWYILHFLLNS